MNIYIIMLIFIVLLFLSRNTDFFSMPQGRNNSTQKEIPSNISNFQKINKDSLSMLTNLNPGIFIVNKKLCFPNPVVSLGAPKQICKNFKGKTVGFNPEEVKKLNMPELFRDGLVSNEVMVPLVVDSIKKIYKNIKEQEKKIDEMIQKIKKM